MLKCLILIQSVRAPNLLSSEVKKTKRSDGDRRLSNSHITGFLLRLQAA